VDEAPSILDVEGLIKDECLWVPEVVKAKEAAKQHHCPPAVANQTAVGRLNPGYEAHLTMLSAVVKAEPPAVSNLKVFAE
jgi:hypothetical protein